ncbi:MAG: (Fe-S)-binding protein [Actinomycetota bacterium]
MPDGVRIALGFAIMFGALGLASRRIRVVVELLRRGRPDPGRSKNVPVKIKAELVKVLAQKKLFQWSFPGLLHALTFWGFLVVQVTLIESVGELFDPEFKLPWIFHGEWMGFVQDSFFALVTLALIGFAIIRVRNAPKKLERKSRFYGSHLGQAYFILFMIFMVVATVAVARGARFALDTLPYPTGAFVSHGIGITMAGLSHNALRWIEDVALLAHLAVVFSFLVIVVNSKHMHIFTAPINVAFGRQPLALGALQPIEIDMENMTEDTVFGAGKLEHLTWKQLLDGITCTECGRCQSVCPAWNTDKPLNPKFIITGIRDDMFTKGDYLLGKKAFDPASPEGQDPEHVMNKALVPGVFSEDVLWACTTCGACTYECPVDIEHVDTIVDMRRYQVMMESAFPHEGGLMLRNLENSGNPWGAPASQRLDWAKGIEDRLVVLNGQMPADAEYLFWVGCAGAFDDRGQKTTRALAELLMEAGIGFAVLGPQETCTGDPARRFGNEYLFQEMAKANIELFNSKGVRKIVTACPHCFNTLGNEYSQFGGEFEVIHHSELLARLVKEGRLKPSKETAAAITYHDPCYLARHNGVVDEPRKVIDSIPGVKTSEPERSGKKTFCCGAGGARMWMEESIGKRVNIERMEQLLETNPDVVAVGCPYCATMMDDAAKELASKGKASEDLKVMDIAQLLAQSVGVGQKAATATESAE